MAISARVAGATAIFTKGAVRVGGVLRPLRTCKVMSGGALQVVATFSTPFAVSAAPSNVDGFAASTKPIRVTSNPCVATAMGGSAPYTYSWVLTSGTSMTIGNPAMATTAFYRTMYGTTVNATARCTVTDATGATATCDVAIELTQENYQ